MKNTHIYFFPRYDESGPSSRYRIYQYIHHFENNNYNCIVNPLFLKKYISNSNIKKIFIFPFLYLIRAVRVLSCANGSIIYIEKELFPYIPYFFEALFFKKKCFYILDYDDAIFVDYINSKSKLVRKILSNKIDRLINVSDHIITGAPFLTKYALRLSKNVTEIPTSVSLSNYNKNILESNNDFIIGWIGSKTTSPNLLQLVNVFKRLSLINNIKIVLIGFDTRLSHMFDGLKVDYIEWESITEINEIYKFTVGIMPLDDTLFNKGKCGFKLIQYMACSKPTISTPTETNIKINKSGYNLHASNESEWFDAIMKIYYNKKYFLEVGKSNRIIFEKYYSVESNIHIYLNIFKQNTK